MNTLKQVKVGQTCTVKRVHGEGALRRRIMDMGITKLLSGIMNFRFVKMMLNLLRLNDRELIPFFRNES